MRFEENLLREFAYTITEPQFLPHRTDAVIILDYFNPRSTGDMAFRVRNRENLARVRFGARIWHYVADKAKKEQQRLPPIPFFYLVGLTLALPHLRQMALSEGIPDYIIRLLDNDAVGIGNTLTQLQLVASDPTLKRAKHITIVSSSYHVPRIRRTAATCLPPDAQMWHAILGVPFEELPFDITMVKAEIDRIIAYSDKGDIARDPRH
ncbi:MAG: hypothetical protein AAB417_00300 [Patescibacteria group bacterium]